MSQQQVMEPDMDNRDPNELNTNVQVQFEDVLGEPESTKSIDCVWRNSYKCFTCGKNCCYKFVTTLCGIFIALCWGCEFALVTFDQVWCVTPALKVCSIYSRCVREYVRYYVGCCCAPCCEAIGLMFSQITVINKTA